MSNELPDPWATELSDKGIHSYREFAAKVGVGHETLRRLVTGGRTSVGTVNRVADELFAGDRDHVWALHGVNVHDHGDWQLPAEASLLTDKQRDAVRAVVRAMVPTIGLSERRNEGLDGEERDRLMADADADADFGNLPVPFLRDVHEDVAAYDPEAQDKSS